MKKTYRVKMLLEGDTKERIYRTDGIPTYACSLQKDYFCWEKNTKYNHYQGWSGYVNGRYVKKCLDNYNPDGLILE